MDGGYDVGDTVKLHPSPYMLNPANGRIINVGSEVNVILCLPNFEYLVHSVALFQKAPCNGMRILKQEHLGGPSSMDQEDGVILELTWDELEEYRTHAIQNEGPSPNNTEELKNVKTELGRVKQELAELKQALENKDKEIAKLSKNVVTPGAVAKVFDRLKPTVTPGAKPKEESKASKIKVFINMTVQDMELMRGKADVISTMVHKVLKNADSTWANKIETVLKAMKVTFRDDKEPERRRLVEDMTAVIALDGISVADCLILQTIFDSPQFREELKTALNDKGCKVDDVGEPVCEMSSSEVPWFKNPFIIALAASGFIHLLTLICFFILSKKSVPNRKDRDSPRGSRTPDIEAPVPRPVELPRLVKKRNAISLEAKSPWELVQSKKTFLSQTSKSGINPRNADLAFKVIRKLRDAVRKGKAKLPAPR